MYNNKYQDIKSLGVGGFGEARLCKDMATGELVAIKVMPRGSKINENVIREIKCHRQLHHPNVVGFKEVFNTPQHLNIVMEYAQHGDLFDYITQKLIKCNERLARYFFQQVVVGLDYCHQSGVCHRDLKLENTLLGGENNAPVVKICDFGYAKNELTDSVPHTKVGTTVYVAPEVLSQSKYDGKTADVWSCGVLLYTMLTGCYPFIDPREPRNDQKTMDRILAVQWHIPSSVQLTPDCQSLLNSIFVADPTARYTLGDIMQHPWFRQNLATEIFSEEYKRRKAYPESQQSMDSIVRILEEARSRPSTWLQQLAT